MVESSGDTSRETNVASATPNDANQYKLNRLAAKAARRQLEHDASASTIPNANGKRPISTSAVPTNASGSSTKALQRDARLGKYFDYDLSKMVNTKGGFLVEEGDEGDEEIGRKVKERERQRARQVIEPSMHLDPALNPKCIECRSMDIDETFRKIFRCNVCKKCQNDKPEKYSLLTKTECKEDYLLTDSELRDEELLPHLLKANPHQSTYANMMLYMRFQVEEFAWKKWGSPEALDAEYERRVQQKKLKKTKKFQQGLKDLRRKTKEGVWQRRKDAEHRHEFGPSERRPDGIVEQICHSCGFTIELEEF